MKWHLAHGHEIPAAIDALGKDYEAKASALEKENSQLKKKVEQLLWELERDEAKLVEEKKEKIQLHKQISELRLESERAMMKLAARDILIKEELNIDMPPPSFK